MRIILYCTLLLLVLSGANTYAQTRVRGHYNRLNQWVPTYYRPYYPGDIYRRNYTPVVIVVPGQSAPKTVVPEVPSLPAQGDQTGMWVESLQKREENGQRGVEMAREMARKMDRERAEKERINKNPNP